MEERKMCLEEQPCHTDVRHGYENFNHTPSSPVPNKATVSRKEMCDRDVEAPSEILRESRRTMHCSGDARGASNVARLICWIHMHM